MEASKAPQSLGSLLSPQSTSHRPLKKCESNNSHGSPMDRSNKCRRLEDNQTSTFKPHP